MKPTIVRLMSCTSQPFTIKHGAVQTGVVETSRFLQKDFNVYVIHASKSKDTRTAVDSVIYCGIKLNFIQKLFADYFYLKKAIKLIKSLKAEIVHVHNRPLYLKLLREFLPKSIKIILHEHNHNLREAISSKEAIKALLACDKVIEISNFSYKFDLKDPFPEFASKGIVVHRGINPLAFKPKWTQGKFIEKLRKKYKIPDQKIVILYAGAIEQKKGIHLLMAAFKKLLLRHPEAFLLIAGGSSWHTLPLGIFGKNFLEELSSLGENALYLGFINADDMPHIYLLADIFCAPSLWEEPFGLVFIEAQASGLPVIASQRGGIPEIILNKKTGLLVKDPENIDSLYRKLRLLLSSEKLRMKLSRNGYQRVITNFTWEITAQKYQEIYNNLK